MAAKRAKRVKINVEIDVSLAPGCERDEDVKATLRDAVAEWFRREWRINGCQPGQHGPNAPPPSKSGDTITLLDSEDEAEAKTWGTVKVSWEIG